MQEFEKMSYPTARKEHRCMICQRVIENKEKYFKRTGRCSGDFFEEKCCLDCESILKEFWNNLDSDGYYNEGNVSDWLKDNFCWNCEDKDACKYGYYEVARCKKIKDGIENPSVAEKP